MTKRKPKPITTLADLTPDPRNARRHTPHNVGMIEAAMGEVGAARSIVIDENGVILAGNATVDAAGRAGIERVQVVDGDGETLIAVRRTGLTAAQKTRLALYDNRAAELAEWDADVLAGIVAEDDALLAGLFGRDELAEIMAQIEQAEPPGDPGEQLNRAGELVEQYGVERGQLWQLGAHRLIVGDAYLGEDRARLLDGAQPGLLHIDPPYGVNIVQPSNGKSAAAIGGAKPFGATSGRKALPAFRGQGIGGTSNTARTGGVAEPDPTTGRVQGICGVARHQIIQSNLYPVIQGDDRPFDPTAFLDLAPIVIMWGANYYAPALPPSPCWIVWDKREDITRNSFADCEIAWCNQSSPARLFHHLWNGLHKGSQHGERRTHPTEKPVALFEEIGRMFCESGPWLDLFAGTGAQLIAAERAGVTCYACEIEPLYAATLLDRWATMTGRTPERIGGA